MQSGPLKRLKGEIIILINFVLFLERVGSGIKIIIRQIVSRWRCSRYLIVIL